MNNRPSTEIEAPRSGFVDHERKLIELKDSETRYRRLFETAKDGILILDGDSGRITDVNPFLQDMLGYSKADLIGKALWEIGPVKDIAASQKAMRNLQNSEYIRYEDLPLETRTGERKQVEFVSNVYLVNGWKVIQCNIRDITARKSAEAREQLVKDDLLTLVEDLQSRNRRIQLLNHMSGLLQACITQAEAYQVIGRIALDLFSEQSGCLAILHPGEQNLQVVTRWGVDELFESNFSLEDCWALRQGKFYEISEPQAGIRCNHFRHAPQTGTACLPLIIQGEILGVICLIDKATRKDNHSFDQQQLAVTIGETIKLSLSNIKLRDELRQLAIHDPLTGLLNRRYLEDVFPRDLQEARRQNISPCFAMLDLDHYKLFNDTYGHDPGDLLLSEFGSVLLEHLHENDILCHYESDRFVIILPDSSIADAQERMEQIRTCIKGRQMHYGGQELNMTTFSAGIAKMPEHGTTAMELLRAAGKALDIAKQAGRDRTIISEAEQ